jgi:hypothetical protein
MRQSPLRGSAKLSRRQRFGKLFRIASWCLVLVCLLCGAMAAGAYQHRKQFAREVQERLDQLDKVEVGRSSRAETLDLISGLKPVLSTSGEFYLCGQNPDCVVGGTASPGWRYWNIQSDKLSWIIEKTHSQKAVGTIFRMLGAEFGWTRLCVTFCDGRVQHWGYEITATNRAADSIMLVVVAAPTTNVLMHGRPHDENLDFWVDHIFDNWGDLMQKVVFTPAASEQLKRVATHPDLTCLQSYRGCETAKQLIPGALAADSQIREASVQRLRGAEPCPERILRSYARSASWIATAEIRSVRNDPEASGARLVQLRSVVPLKGVPRDVDRDLYMLDYSDVGQHVELNRVVSFAKPGNKVILLAVGAEFFTGGDCATIPASEENLRAVQHEIDGRMIQGSEALAARSGRQ